MVNYDAYATTFSNSRKKLQWPELDTIIEDMGQCGYTSMLDIGCGNGRFIEQLGVKNEEGRVKNYLGIDNSAGMIAEARKLHPAYQFEVCPMESVSSHPTIQPSYYDAIIFLASFHHLETREERIQVLRDIRKYLTPSGAIYMTNWNLRDQPKYEKSRRKMTEIYQKQEFQGRKVFSKGVYGSVNEGEQNFPDTEIRSFSEISYDYDIKIGEYSRYYHGFTVEELAELFHETGYQIIENRIFEGGKNIWSKIQVI